LTKAHAKEVGKKGPSECGFAVLGLSFHLTLAAPPVVARYLVASLSRRIGGGVVGENE
jgi:hypothetical protein